MAEFRFNIDGDEDFNRIIKKLQSVGGEVVKRELERAGAGWKFKVGDNFGPYSPEGSSWLQRRTGTLKRSLRTRLVDAGANANVEEHVMVLQAGSGEAPYAKTHEYGATITGKGGGYLKIPMPAALTARGRVSGKAKTWMEDGKEWSGFGPTHMAPLKKGDGYAILAETNWKRKALTKSGKRKRSFGDDPKYELLFVLKRKVVIPGPESTGDRSKLGARRVLGEVATEEFIPNLMAALQRATRGEKP